MQLPLLGVSWNSPRFQFKLPKKVTPSDGSTPRAATKAWNVSCSHTVMGAGIQVPGASPGKQEPCSAVPKSNLELMLADPPSCKGQYAALLFAAVVLIFVQLFGFRKAIEPAARVCTNEGGLGLQDAGCPEVSPEITLARPHVQTCRRKRACLAGSEWNRTPY